MERYRIVERIAEGTFGEVHKAVAAATGQVVALKRVRLRNVEEGLPNTALREMRALQELDHPNIIRLLDFFPQASSLVLVFEFMRTDLDDVLKAARKPLPEAHVKAYMQMLLKGVAFIHANSIIHRDLKPANLLLAPEGVLKIGDFGLARVHTPHHTGNYTHQVATRWFRAPELLFGARRYGHGVDLWAVGAIFGELLHHAPLFPGENDIDQIYRVLQVMGTPTDANWPGVRELPDYAKITFPSLKPLPMRTLLPNASPAALDLLAKFLVYDPARRISAEDALMDPYFFSEPLPAEPHELARDGGTAAGSFAGQLDLYVPFLVPEACAPMPRSRMLELASLLGEDALSGAGSESAGTARDEATDGSGKEEGRPPVDVSKHDSGGLLSPARSPIKTPAMSEGIRGPSRGSSGHVSGGAGGATGGVTGDSGRHGSRRRDRRTKANAPQTRTPPITGGRKRGTSGRTGTSTGTGSKHVDRRK